MKFIAMIPNYWGRGDSIHEAIRQVKKSKGSVRPGTQIVLFGYAGQGNVWVDEMGGIAYEWTDEEMELDRPDRPRSFEIGRGTVRGNSVTFQKPEE